MQVRKQQLEPEEEQWTDSKLGKKYVKAVYCHPAYLTSMQSVCVCVCVCVCVRSVRPDLMDCILQGFCVRGILQVFLYQSALPFPSPGDLPNPGVEPGSPALQADSLPSEPSGKPSIQST